MSVMGPNPAQSLLAQSAAGSAAAERVAKDKKPPEKPTVANRRTNDLVTVRVEGPDEVRSVNGNADEEARRERQGQPMPKQLRPQPPTQRHIDLQG